MTGGMEEEIVVNPSNQHYCSDCTVYLAVYGFRVTVQVADPYALLLLLYHFAFTYSCLPYRCPSSMMTL